MWRSPSFKIDPSADNPSKSYSVKERRTIQGDSPSVLLEGRDHIAAHTDGINPREASYKMLRPQEGTTKRRPVRGPVAALCAFGFLL
jgi:hypothetical protein